MSQESKVGPNRKRPKTGGRQKGTPNKATAEIKEAAQAYGPAAIEKLAELAGLVTGKGKAKAESEAAQVAALRDILDRGYGKATQPLAGDKENPLFDMAGIEKMLAAKLKKLA